MNNFRQRQPIKLSILICSIVFCSACGTAGSKENDHKERRHNLLFILTDEQRYDTSAPYGNKQIETPHLNRLGQEAWVFQKAYVTQPVCSPDRSALMTGYFPHQSGVTANNIPLADSIPVLPALFPDSIYTTAYVGKWHLGSELEVREGFDQRISTEDGYTSADTTTFSDYHHWLIEKGYEPDVKEFGIFSRGFCNRLPLEHTKSKFMEEQALDFLDQNAQEPFMLYLAFLEPHTPNFGPFDDLHSPEQITLDSTYGSMVPVHEPLRYKMIRNPSGKVAAREELKKEMAKYWGLVHQVDQSLGEIIAKLKEIGQYENTIIVYTSEHGKLMGKYGIGGKSVMYEASVRVPLFIKIPGQSAQAFSTPVSQIDLVPTLIHSLGGEIPSEMPGKSLLVKTQDSMDENIFIEWHPGLRRVDYAARCPEGFSEVECQKAWDQVMRSVITPDGWKLCKSVGDADTSQLFNLNNDPMEVRNLYYDADYRSQRDSLMQLLREWQVTVDDPNRL